MRMECTAYPRSASDIFEGNKSWSRGLAGSSRRALVRCLAQKLAKGISEALTTLQPMSALCREPHFWLVPLTFRPTSMRRSHETAVLQLWVSARKSRLFRRLSIRRSQPANLQPSPRRQTTFMSPRPAFRFWVISGHFALQSSCRFTCQSEHLGQKRHSVDGGAM